MANPHALSFHFRISTEREKKKVSFDPKGINVSAEEKKTIAHITLKKNTLFSMSEMMNSKRQKICLHMI